MRVQHRARAKKADSGDDLSRNPRRISANQRRDFRGNAHEQSRTDANQDVGPKACRLLTNLTLQPDHSPQKGGESELS